MKARADDRRLFNDPIKLNVLALQESKGLDTDALTRALQTVAQPKIASHPASVFGDDDLFPGTLPQSSLRDSMAAADTKGDPMRPVIAALIDTFANAKTFGSLIQIPDTLTTHLRPLPDVLAVAKQSGDMYATAAADDLWPLVKQAQVLAMQFDAVVANPPYMGSGAMNSLMKGFAKERFPNAKLDLFSCFIDRTHSLTKVSGHSSMVTMQSWMFLTAFQQMREEMLRRRTVSTLVQIGYNSFPSMNSKVAQAAAFSLLNHRIENLTGTYVDLNSAHQSADKEEVFLAHDPKNTYLASAERFSKIPGSPISYTVSDVVLNAYATRPSVDSIAKTCNGMTTSDNERFLRFWHEVSFSDVNRGVGCRDDARKIGVKWVPYNKGGAYRKWWGNQDFVIDWRNDGKSVIDFAIQLSGSASKTIRNLSMYFQPCISWSRISSGPTSFRAFPSGFIFDVASCAFFLADQAESLCLMGFLNSHVARILLRATSPTLTFEAGAIGRLPFDLPNRNAVVDHADRASSCIEFARADWNDFERSWDFASSPLVSAIPERQTSLERRYQAWTESNDKRVAEVKRLEEEMNRLIIDSYDLGQEIESEVPLEQITLTVNAAHRYGNKLADEELAVRFRQDSVKEVCSYAIGCMMGRYSLDEPGLIYAHAGNVGFDTSRYVKFPADADGIVPLTDELWFGDDTASRVRDFLLVVWGAETLDENMAWLAESLGTKAGETPEETIRRYLASSFYKDHLQTYKKRPIYWLFSSGKQGAFQALVYLHRYHEGTLARMRAEYVVPLTGKIQSRIEMLKKDADAATSTAARNKLNKEAEKLKKKHVELLAYDEQLRHYADMRITLDLDDGVKVNYGKFGDLLAEVKAVTGGTGDE